MRFVDGPIRKYFVTFLELLKVLNINLKMISVD